MGRSRFRLSLSGNAVHAQAVITHVGQGEGRHQGGQISVVKKRIKYDRHHFSGRLYSKIQAIRRRNRKDVADARKGEKAVAGYDEDTGHHVSCRRP